MASNFGKPLATVAGEQKRQCQALVTSPVGLCSDSEASFYSTYHVVKRWNQQHQEAGWNWFIVVLAWLLQLLLPWPPASRAKALSEALPQTSQQG